MTNTFPLTRGQFWELLRFAGRPEFDLQFYQQQSIDGAGNMIPATLGQPKWHADVSTSPGMHNDDMTVQAMLKLLRGRNGTFLAYDTRRPYPLLDPGGALIAGNTVTIKSVGADNRSVALNGLLAHYNLSLGDKFAVSDGSGHRCLLECMEAVGTAGNTYTTEFEVQPFLPTWLAVGNSVDLIKPTCRFKIVPGTYKPQSGAGNASDGISFSMISVP